MHNIWCIKSTTLWEFFSLSKQSTCFPKISVSSPMYLLSMPSFLYTCSPYDMVAHVINPWVQVVQTSCKLSSKTPFFVKKKLKNKKNLTNYGYSALSTCQAFSQKWTKISLSLQGKQVIILLPMIKIWAFEQNQNFGKSVSTILNLSASQYLDFYDY